MLKTDLFFSPKTLLGDELIAVGEHTQKPYKIVKSTSDYITDDRMRLRNTMSLRSLQDINNSGHLLDLERFIGDSSKNNKRHLANKEY